MSGFYELFVRGIPVTRYIASWYIAGGDDDIHKVRKWLKSLVINGSNLSDYEVEHLAECVVNGKLELEESAKKFV